MDHSDLLIVASDATTTIDNILKRLIAHSRERGFVPVSEKQALQKIPSRLFPQGRGIPKLEYLIHRLERREQNK